MQNNERRSRGGAKKKVGRLKHYLQGIKQANPEKDRIAIYWIAVTQSPKHAADVLRQLMKHDGDNMATRYWLHYMQWRNDTIHSGKSLIFEKDGTQRQDLSAITGGIVARMEMKANDDIICAHDKWAKSVEQHCTNLKRQSDQERSQREKYPEQKALHERLRAQGSPLAKGVKDALNKKVRRAKEKKRRESKGAALNHRAGHQESAASTKRGR